MENLFKPPEPLVLDGNISDNWRRFSQKFDLFMEATNLESKPEAKKVAIFLNSIGDEALELYNTLPCAEGEQRTFAVVKEKLEAYCLPRENVIFEQFKFNNITQKERQTLDSFVTELRKAIKTTHYVNPDDMIRDRLVIGIHDKHTQEKLLRESQLTLNKAIDVSRTIEISKDQSKILQNETVVHAIKPENQTSIIPCKFCGYKHQVRKCPAYEKTCVSCQGRNHFANVCR